MAKFKNFAAGTALAAAASMAATPAMAVDLPLPQGPAQPIAVPYEASEDDSANHHRRYRYRRHRGGDVLAGILILGGIAAVASAASKNNRDRDYRYRDRDYRDRDYRYRDRDYRDRRDDRRYDSRGIDRAVEMCLREIERDARVDSVDEVERDGSGWEVKGTLYNGESFECEIGSDGRIKDLDYGGRSLAAAAPVDDRQWDDDRYAQARAQVEGQAVQPASAPESEAARPAYPGGPLPGEEIDADFSGDDDGRYSTADAPDFAET